MPRKASRAIVLLFVIALAAQFMVPISIGRSQMISEADAIHRELIIADLHVDPLLWNRDLSRPQPRAQVDLAKLKAGGVNVAVFGVVTAGLPVIGGWRLFTLWRGWPKEARRSRWRAALNQIERLSALVERSEGSLLVASTAGDVDRAISNGQIAAMIGVEGAQALEGDVARVSELREMGVIYMSPVHLAGNELAGASYPLTNRGGFTAYGREVVQEMEREGIFVDVAHLSKKAFWEVLALTRGPVLCSHTGVYAVERSWRNLDDDQLKAIAGRGGVIGIMLATNFLGGRDLERWVEHVRHVVDLVGVEHVALGSDMDGFVPLPKEVRDISQLCNLTRVLLEAGFDKESIRKILGENFLSMLREHRP